MSLYHYTCHHRATLIRDIGVVVPNSLFWAPDVELSWWTDLEKPDRYALGLTSYMTGCDRTEFRFAAADDADLTPWGHWAHARKVSRIMRDMLEGDGAAPAHWWVSEAQVVVL